LVKTKLEISRVATCKAASGPQEHHRAVYQRWNTL
jgi:hypothetical protein